MAPLWLGSRSQILFILRQTKLYTCPITTLYVKAAMLVRSTCCVHWKASGALVSIFFATMLALTPVGRDALCASRKTDICSNLCYVSAESRAAAFVPVASDAAQRAENAPPNLCHHVAARSTRRRRVFRVAGTEAEVEPLLCCAKTASARKPKARGRTIHLILSLLDFAPGAPSRHIWARNSRQNGKLCRCRRQSEGILVTFSKADCTSSDIKSNYRIRAIVTRNAENQPLGPLAPLLATATERWHRRRSEGREDPSGHRMYLGSYSMRSV